MNLAEGRPAPSFLPSTAILELTYRCNHSCLFCYCPWESDSPKFARLPELDTAGWKEIISKLCRMGITNFGFSGGEALMRPDALELLAHAAGERSLHFRTVDGKLAEHCGPPSLNLISNGTLVDEEVLRFCADHGVLLSLSLPGLSSYEAHTGTDGADRVLALFGRASALGVRTCANITVTALNYPEIERVFAGALLAGAGQLLINRFLPGGRGVRNAEKLMLSREQIPGFLEAARWALDASGRAGSIGTELPLCLVGKNDYGGLAVSTRCGAANDFFVVGPSGYVRVCNHSPVRLVHVQEIEKLKDDAYWRFFVARDYLPESCGVCEERYRCDGGCREAANVCTGSPRGPDVALGGWRGPG